MRKLIGPTTFLLLALSCAGHAASPCDPDLIPAGEPNQYRPRSPGLCEGLYASRVAAPPIELVSFTRGSIPAAASRLDLSVPVPAGLASVRLRGTGIPNGLYYRLDAEISPGQVLRWSAGGVLGPLGIQLVDIGLFAFADDATGTPVYYPVDIESTVSEPSVSVAEFRTADLADDLRWRFVPNNGANSSISWHDADSDNDRLKVALPPGSGLLEVGWSDQQSGQPRLASFQIGG